MSLNTAPVQEIRYLAGIDGGGTATRACLVSCAGEQLGFATAGPSALGQGVDQAWRNVLAALEGAFRAADIARWQRAQCALGLGLAGAIVPAQRREFLARAEGFRHVELASDGYTMLLGAHAGSPGAVVASGTGSIGEALQADGLHVVIGGWGFPVDDEGSGAWIGMRAVREAQNAIDGRAPHGPLARAVHKAIGDNRDAVLAWSRRAGQHAYAALAPLVFDAAATDPAASRLLDDAARALDDIARALDRDGTLPLVVSGSVGTRLVARMSAEMRARLVEPAGDAVDGALRLVRAALDRRIPA
jgi:glucosamine kinase